MGVDGEKEENVSSHKALKRYGTKKYQVWHFGQHDHILGGMHKTNKSRTPCDYEAPPVRHTPLPSAVRCNRCALTTPNQQVYCAR